LVNYIEKTSQSKTIGKILPEVVRFYVEENISEKKKKWKKHMEKNYGINLDI
jgi:hypothetical protein